MIATLLRANDLFMAEDVGNRGRRGFVAIFTESKTIWLEETSQHAGLELGMCFCPCEYMTDSGTEPAYIYI